ncbi:MAG: prolipoprotein diacylglyceryl transferase [Saprospiraceae bacterium]|nr:prolipoprotein diacylglyceryl transferase [Saprospiraceae bacterium]
MSGKRAPNQYMFMDIVAPALILGYAVGRIGCQLSGDGELGCCQPPAQTRLVLSTLIVGGPMLILTISSMMGCRSQIVLIDIVCNFPSRYTLLPLWEALMGLAIFGILWAIRKGSKITGMLFFIYCIFNRVERFFIEKYVSMKRSISVVFSMTQAEIISLLVFLTGVVGCYILWKKIKPLSLNRQ